MKRWLKPLSLIVSSINVLISLITATYIYFSGQGLLCFMLLGIQAVGGIVLMKYLIALHQHITRDCLTGLGNKEYFSNQLEKLIESSKRHNRSFSVLFLDIDNFKAINDKYGHVMGDKVLVHFSGVLKKNVRSYDVIVRWGGDEFALILPETGKCEAKGFVSRIQSVLKTPVGNHSLQVSIGFSVFDPGSPLSGKELVEEADRMLYKMKRRHKESRNDQMPDKLSIA